MQGEDLPSKFVLPSWLRSPAEFHYELDLRLKSKKLLFVQCFDMTLGPYWNDMRLKGPPLNRHSVKTLVTLRCLNLLTRCPSRDASRIPEKIFFGKGSSIAMTCKGGGDTAPSDRDYFCTWTNAGLGLFFDQTRVARLNICQIGSAASIHISIMHTVHPNWYHIIQCQRQKVYNEDGSWLCDCGQEIYWRMFASVRKTIHFGDDFNGLQNMTFGDWFRQSLDKTTLPISVMSLTVGDRRCHGKLKNNIKHSNHKQQVQSRIALGFDVATT